MTKTVLAFVWTVLLLYGQSIAQATSAVSCNNEKNFCQKLPNGNLELIRINEETGELDVERDSKLVEADRESIIAAIAHYQESLQRNKVGPELRPLIDKVLQHYPQYIDAIKTLNNRSEGGAIGDQGSDQGQGQSGFEGGGATEGGREGYSGGGSAGSGGQEGSESLGRGQERNKSLGSGVPRRGNQPGGNGHFEIGPSGEGGGATPKGVERSSYSPERQDWTPDRSRDPYIDQCLKSRPGSVNVPSCNSPCRTADHTLINDGQKITLRIAINLYYPDVSGSARERLQQRMDNVRTRMEWYFAKHGINLELAFNHMAGHGTAGINDGNAASVSERPVRGYNNYNWAFAQRTGFGGLMEFDDDLGATYMLHEMGHKLGLRDEYFLSGLGKPDSLMRNPQHGLGGAKLYPKHIRQILQPLCG